MNYNELTLRYFAAAPHAGVLSREVASVYRGAAGNREHGTWVQFDIQVDADRCIEARFLAFGCPHTIAVAAWAAEQARDSLLRGTLPEPVAALAQRFEIPAEKMGRLLIVEDAWAGAATRALTVAKGDPTSKV